MATVHRCLAAKVVPLTVVALASLAACQLLFSSFATYDDEGYLLLSLRQYLQGRPLYEAIYTQYGPAYYVLHGLLHSVFAWPVTHDVARLKMLVVWLAAAAMCAVFVVRVTHMKTLGCVAFLACYFHLDRLGIEPAHPQDVCLLAVTGTFLLATYLRFNSARRADAYTLAAMGLLTAAAAMTKINVGFLLFVGVIMTLFAAAPRRRLTLVLQLFCLGIAMLLPWGVARHHGWTLEGAQLPTVVTVAVGLTAWVSWRLCLRPSVGTSAAACYGAAMVAGCAVFAAMAMWHGSSPAGLIHGVVRQHAGFIDIFYEDPPVYRLAIPCALVAAVLARLAMRGRYGVVRVAYLVVAVLALGIGLRHLGDTFTPLTHGASDRGQAALLMSLFTPFVWIVLLPYGKGAWTSCDWMANGLPARQLLCTVSALQPLIVYPVPGTQVAVGSLGLLLAVLVSVGDCLRDRSILGEREDIFRRGLLASLLAMALLTLACRDIWYWRVRAACVPLNLAGAERLRLPRELVAREQWIVAQLQARADTFLCLQSGHNSLYLWSGLEPPTGWNATLWQDLLSDEQQEQIVCSLNNRHRVCVVVDNAEPSPKRPNGVLARYLRENFVPATRNGSTEVWTRRGADVNAFAGPR